MSLINEALKKAQRARGEAQGPTDAPPLPGGGARIAKRGRSPSANTMVLLGGGAFVLIVISVIATVYFVKSGSGPQTTIVATAAPNTDKSPVATAPAPAPAKASSAAASAAPPNVVAPTITPPASLAHAPAVAAPPPPIGSGAPAISPSPTPATPPAAVATTPPTAPAAGASETRSPTRTAATTSPASSRPAGPPKPDERINAFVDSVRVAGIRSSGNESRVLMNDRVYRVNDIVERNLGVRLIKVDVDSLTFSDSNGFKYVKMF